MSTCWTTRGSLQAAGSKSMAAPGTEIEAMIERPAVDRLGREGVSLVLGVSGLATDPASLLTLRRRRLGRLDDVGGRGLGGGRGILPRRGELLLETRDGGLERLNRASWASNCACKRRQFGQDFRALVFMARYAKSPAAISP